MFLKGYKHRDIQEVLEVSPGFIGQETKREHLTFAAKLEIGVRSQESGARRKEEEGRRKEPEEVFLQI
jgi:hypothetical protein